MNELEKSEIRSRVKAMTDEEKQFALMHFPTQMVQDEITRRCEVVAEVVEELHKTVGTISDNTTLVEMQDIIQQCKTILKIVR